ncbi:MAG: tRNA (adenosine(37)-N6)-threonylcarbamoyltransferase complex transferase subunit TsaD [Vicinamibacterales bacterium]
MLMLGIETSCDETSAAVVEETGEPSLPWRIRSNIVASQVEIHREWGGVVPELASRQHLRDICGVVERALADASVEARELGAVAVTAGPGLVGSLLVGVAFAKAAALAWGRPLVPVHHLAGHIESLFLAHGPLPLPSAVLVVSGGHTSLYEVTRPGRYRLLGRTRDDAAGEAYDKVAKLLGLEYPGGPVIDRLARLGDDRAVVLPLTRMTHADRMAPGVEGRLDFSFSGLKTAVSRHVRKRLLEIGSGTGYSAPPGQRGDPLRQDQPRAEVRLPESEVADVCASFQRTVVETLLDRTFDAAWRIGARSVGIAGGVSANSRLRADATARGVAEGLPVFIPPLSLSTDNAAMIAAAGLRAYYEGRRASDDLNADASLALR